MFEPYLEAQDGSVRSGQKCCERSAAGKRSPGRGSRPEAQPGQQHGVIMGRMLSAACMATEARGGRNTLDSSQERVDKGGKCLYSFTPTNTQAIFGPRDGPLEQQGGTSG